MKHIIEGDEVTPILDDTFALNSSLKQGKSVEKKSLDIRTQPGKRKNNIHNQLEIESFRSKELSNRDPISERPKIKNDDNSKLSYNSILWNEVAYSQAESGEHTESRKHEYSKGVMNEGLKEKLLYFLGLILFSFTVVYFEVRFTRVYNKKLEQCSKFEFTVTFLSLCLYQLILNN